MILTVASELENYLVERVFDDPGCLGCLQARNYIASYAFLDDGVDRDPL
jgi:hypothetical protein